MKKRTPFTREFKLEAIRLLEEGKQPVADLARELGIRRNQLYKWKEQKDNRGDSVFPGHGRHAGTSSESEEIARLKRELGAEYGTSINI